MICKHLMTNVHASILTVSCDIASRSLSDLTLDRPDARMCNTAARLLQYPVEMSETNFKKFHKVHDTFTCAVAGEIRRPLTGSHQTTLAINPGQSSFFINTRLYKIR